MELSLAQEQKQEQGLELELKLELMKLTLLSSTCGASPASLPEPLRRLPSHLRHLHRRLHLRRSSPLSSFGVR
jgi:hypothetical protein